MCLTKVRPSTDKFHSRAENGVFLGFVTGQKGYKIYSMDTKRIVISRDVGFHETQFPFLQNNSHLDTEFEDTTLLPFTQENLDDCDSYSGIPEPHFSGKSELTSATTPLEAVFPSTHR